LHKKPTHSGALYHAPDADGLDIKSTSVLTGSVHTTVNALREAIAVQRMLERDARGGTRSNLTFQSLALEPKTPWRPVSVSK
jgi:hypothetical protein